jgi:hypothetical protein
MRIDRRSPKSATSRAVFCRNDRCSEHPQHLDLGRALREVTGRAALFAVDNQAVHF